MKSYDTAPCPGRSAPFGTEIVIRRIMALPTLICWRAEVISSVFGTEPDARLLVANRRYYREHLADGSHLAFVASCNGEDAGCGSLCLTDELPSPDNPTGRCGYLMNVYVREAYRHRGVGRAIVERLVEEARLSGCGKVTLETTAAARALYARLGFTVMDAMMILKQ